MFVQLYAVFSKQVSRKKEPYLVCCLLFMCRLSFRLTILSLFAMFYQVSCLHTNTQCECVSQISLGDCPLIYIHRDSRTFCFHFRKKKGRHYSRVCGVVFPPLYFSDICFLEKQWDQRDVIPAGEGCLRKAKIMDGSGKVYLKVMEGPLCLLLVMERKHTYVKIWLYVHKTTSQPKL